MDLDETLSWPFFDDGHRRFAQALARFAGLGQDLLHLLEREGPGDHAQADVVAETDTGGQAGGGTGHRCRSPKEQVSASMPQLHPYVNGIGSSPNVVHFTIRTAAAKSIRVVGCGARGRSM